MKKIYLLVSGLVAFATLSNAQRAYTCFDLGAADQAKIYYSSPSGQGISPSGAPSIIAGSSSTITYANLACGYNYYSSCNSGGGWLCGQFDLLFDQIGGSPNDTTVSAGTAKTVQFSLSATGNLGTASPAATFEVKLYDAAGNNTNGLDLTLTSNSATTYTLNFTGQENGADLTKIVKISLSYKECATSISGDLSINALKLGTCTVASVNAGNFDNSNFTIYPNPAAANSTIDFKTVSSGKISCIITDASGKKVELFSKSLAAGNHSEAISLAAFNNGLYHVSLMDEANGIISTQLVVNNK